MIDFVLRSIGDYAELAIQYGYGSMFVTALPLASFYAFASNLIECKGDPVDLLLLSRVYCCCVACLGDLPTVVLDGDG